MKIAELKTLEEGIVGFTVQAKLLNAFEVKEFKGMHGPFKKQAIQLVDGEEKIYARLSSGFVSKSDIGKDIEIVGCILGSYKDAPQIDTNSKSSVKIKREATTTATVRKETVSPPKGFLDTVTEAIEEVQLILEHPKLEEAVKIGKEKGLTSEDVRAMIISRMIEKSRGR